MAEHFHFSGQIPPEYAAWRLDQALAELLPEHSRARLQAWIKSGHLTLNGQACRPKDKVRFGDQVDLDVTLTPQALHDAQAIALDIVYEDEDILVLNKAAGLVVHPAAGHASGTLLNALLHQCPQLDTVPRAGIVHRLDKDTSGLMVVAKHVRAQTHLVEQLQARTMKREYYAFVYGSLISGGTVDAPMGRHPQQRKKMAVVAQGKPARTHYRVLERFAAHTWVKCQLESGRTHQIRVHMAHVHHPLIGDPLYLGRLKLPAGASVALKEHLRTFPRQALHAYQLGLVHPRTGEMCSWQAPMPEDMQLLLAALRQG